MHYEEASAIGNEGERRVSAKLARLSHAHQFQYLDNLLLETRGRTAQLDHVIVDPFGVLIIETKVRRALIRGTSTDKKWTACYSKGEHETFQNPLDQNRQHEGLLRRVLAERGFPVDPDYITSAVVFVDANIRYLELKALDRARVATIDEIEQLLRNRRDYAVNDGAWAVQDVSRAADELRAANRASDPSVSAAHARHARRGEVPSRRPGPAPRRISQQRVVQACETSLPAHPRPPAPLAATRPRSARSLRELGQICLLCGFIAFVWWLFTGGMAMYEASFETSAMPATPAPEPPQRDTRPPVTVEPTLRDAQNALLESFPSVYPQVCDLDAPTVTRLDDGYQFTWEYVDQTGPRSLRLGTVSVTLDAGETVIAFELE